MVTAAKFLKLLSAKDDNEIEAIISKMPEQDAKSFLKTIISEMNKRNKESIEELFGEKQ